MAGISGEFWQHRGGGGGGWGTAAVVLFIVLWQIIINRHRRRCAAVASATATHLLNDDPSLRVSKIISDADLKDLINSLESKADENVRWEDVFCKKNSSVSYSAKCCRPKDGPLKYISVTIFEGCSPELLRNFYMDNEYRRLWDKTVIEHKQLEVDESSGIEIGLTSKKFPLLTPREYVLAWRVWEGKDGSFYCFVKDCEHPLAPRRKNYVRVGLYRSGWRIRRVPGRDACEISLLHQEDAGMNMEMAKLAFARGIWKYVCKMDNALRQYSFCSPRRSTSILTLCKLIRKVPPELDGATTITSQGLRISSGNGILDVNADYCRSNSIDLSRSSSKKWITKGVLLFGGILYLSRGRSTLGTQLAMACVLKKLMKRGARSGPAEPACTRLELGQSSL